MVLGSVVLRAVAWSCPGTTGVGLGLALEALFHPNHFPDPMGELPVPGCSEPPVVAFSSPCALLSAPGRPFLGTWAWLQPPEAPSDPFLWSPLADLDARPWDFQAEECALRASIERFNARRYDRAHGNPDFVPVDNCLQSVLGQRVDLPEDFQVNYDLWLEREVFSRPISWEELLQ